MGWASAVHELYGARSLCGTVARGGLSRANLHTVLRKARRGGRNTGQTGRCAMRWCWTVLAAHLSWIEGSALCAAVLATWATVAAGSRPRRLLWRQSSARSPNRADDAGTAVLAERAWHATRSDTNRQLPGGHLGRKETMATAPLEWRTALRGRGFCSAGTGENGPYVGRNSTAPPRPAATWRKSGGVVEAGHHASIHVVGVVAVQQPDARVVGDQGYRDALHW